MWTWTSAFKSVWTDLRASSCVTVYNTGPVGFMLKTESFEKKEKAPVLFCEKGK